MYFFQKKIYRIMDILWPLNNWPNAKEIYCHKKR